MQLSYSLARDDTGAESEQLTSARKGMETNEIFLVTVIASHYIWNFVFFAWILSTIEPLEPDCYNTHC